MITSIGYSCDWFKHPLSCRFLYNGFHITIRAYIKFFVLIFSPRNNKIRVSVDLVF